MKSINREKVGRENFDESLAVRQIHQSFPRQPFALYGRRIIFIGFWINRQIRIQNIQIRKFCCTHIHT